MQTTPSVWLTVWTLPATLMVADLAAPVFASTWYVTVPDPLPLDPEEMETQFEFSLALHVQPDCVLTLMVPEPPSSVKLRKVGLML